MTLKQSLAYGMILNEMMRYTDFLTMGAQTTGVSLIDFDRTASTLNALGLLYQIYGDNFVGATPVALSGNSPQPAPKFPAGSPDQPVKSSGSPTYPLDMVAALSPDKRYLILSVVNATESEHTFHLRLTGSHLAAAAKLSELTGSSTDAINHAGQPPQIKVKEVQLSGTPGTIAVAPISVNIYRFPLTQ
jgi:alpha-N-arabinofuranosidase